MVYCDAILLIVTFLTFQPTNIIHGNTVSLLSLYLVMVFLVNAVEFVAARAVVVKVHLAFAVTVHAPAHT